MINCGSDDSENGSLKEEIWAGDMLADGSGRQACFALFDFTTEFGDVTKIKHLKEDDITMRIAYHCLCIMRAIHKSRQDLEDAYVPA